MEIIFVTLVDPSGTSGQNLYSKEIASALVRHEDVALSLVCPAPRSPLPDPLSTTPTHHIPQKRSQSVTWSLELQRPLYTILSSLGEEQNVDGIVTPLKPALLLPPLISRWSGIPQVLLVEGMMARNVQKLAPFPGAGLLANVITWMNVNQSRKTFVAYEEAKEWITSLPLVSESKVKIFHHGVNPEMFRPVNKRYARKEINVDLSSNGTVMGFVGSFKEYHCLNVLLRAVSELLDDGFEIQLLLVGDGPQRETLERLASRLGIRDSVSFTGFIRHEEVGVYMSACDVLYGVIDPGHWGSPMKVYEYLACGRPVIAFDSKELSFIRDISAGALVGRVGTSEVVEAIKSICQLSNTERKVMGRAGREYVLANRTWDMLAEKITQSIRSEQRAHRIHDRRGSTNR